jgi:aspartate kinase
MNISSITYCRNVALVTLRNVPYESSIIAEIFSAISENGINVDMISQTAPLSQSISVAFTIALDSMGQLLPIINSFKPKYPELNMELAPGMTKLNFYDPNMVNTPGVAAHVFATLADGNIPVSMITTSTVDISILIREHEEDAALQLYRDTYGVEPEERPFS